MRVATSSLYQPGKALSLSSALRKPAIANASAGVCANVLNMLGTTPRCASKSVIDGSDFRLHLLALEQGYAANGILRVRRHSAMRTESDAACRRSA